VSTDRDITRVVRSWLDEGVTALPDRVLDAVLDQVPTTPQRRSWWPARRFTTLTSYARIGLIAAVVVLAAVVGIGLYTNPVGGPGPTAMPSPTPSLMPSPSPLPSPTPVPNPIVGTMWEGPVVTCEQQIAAAEAAGFTADQITAADLDQACPSGTNQYSLSFVTDGRLVVRDRGDVTHPALYRITGAQTFETSQTGVAAICVTIQYAIDGDQLTLDIIEYGCSATGPAPVFDQVNLTAIYETSSFTRQP